jgi:hypothetical protein
MGDVQRDFHAEAPVDGSRFFPDHGKSSLKDWTATRSCSVDAMVGSRRPWLNGRIVILAS